MKKLDPKIKSIITSVSILLGVSLLISTGLFYLFSWNIIWTTMILCGLQIIGQYCYNKYIETKHIFKILNKYENLKYKKYLIPLICQACGSTNSIEIDLTNTEFVCSKCEKKNAIYINFSTAIISEPLIDPNDILANVSS